MRTRDHRETQALSDALLALAEAWCRAKPYLSSEEALASPPPLPEHLAATLTRREPWRARAEADGRLWIALPQLVTLKMEVGLVETPRLEPFEGWDRSVASLRFATSGTDRMDPNDALPVGTAYLWQRVAYEDEAWRVVSLWDDADRAQHLSYRDLELGRLRGQQGSAPRPPRDEDRPGLLARAHRRLRKVLEPGSRP